MGAALSQRQPVVNAWVTARAVYVRACSGQCCVFTNVQGTAVEVAFGRTRRRSSCEFRGDCTSKTPLSRVEQRLCRQDWGHAPTAAQHWYVTAVQRWALACVNGICRGSAPKAAGDMAPVLSVGCIALAAKLPGTCGLSASGGRSLTPLLSHHGT